MQIRINQKKGDGTYEAVHVETSADLVRDLPVCKQAKFDVVTVPQSVSITFTDGASYQAPEVLKLVSGGAYDSIPVISSAVSLPEAEFDVAVYDPISVESGIVYSTAVLDFAKYKKIDQIEVK